MKKIIHENSIPIRGNDNKYKNKIQASSIINTLLERYFKLSAFLSERDVSVLAGPGLVVPGREAPLHNGGHVVVAHHVPQSVCTQHEDIVACHVLVLDVENANLNARI